MTRSASWAGVAALTAVMVLPFGAAIAHEGPREAAPSNSRPVLVCEKDAATRRAFTREYGSAPVFISAREALSIRTNGSDWSTPRCMTAREHARYRDAVPEL